MSDDRQWRGIRVQTLITVGVMLSVFAAGGAAIGFSDTTPVEAGVPIGAQDGPQVVFQEPVDGDANLKDPWVDNNTLVWNSTAGNMTLSSQGTTEVTVVDIEGAYSRAAGITTNGRALTLNPDDKQSVVVNGGVDAVDWQDTSAVAAGDGQTDFRYAASSSGSIEIGGLQPNAEFVTDPASSATGAAFTTDGSGHATIPVESSSETDVTIKAAPPDPAITSASPADGAQIESSNTTLSATVESPTVSSNTPLSVELTLNGQTVKTAELTANGTVTADVEPPLAETSNWSATVTDAYGQSDTTGTRTFDVPARLKIYDEAEPGQLLDDQNINLSVRFFPLGDSGGSVVTRQADNGTVNLTGLPADSRFVVTVDTENYTFRRIVINSLYETNKIYLLNESESSSQIIFELQDPTGSFPPESTVLYVEKPITVNGTTSYQTIAGDTFGASSTFPAILQDDSRYRLRVATSDGSSERILGFYSVYGSSRETLLIQRIKPSADNRTTSVVYGGLEQDGNSTNLAVRFRGGDPGTTVTYRVTNSTGAVVVAETTTTAQKFAHVYPVDADGQFTVNWTIEDADGNTRSGQFAVGTIDGVDDRLNADPQVLSLISWVAILATMGLVVLVNPKLAPAAGTGMASFLVILGTVAIPAPMLGVSGAISALTIFGGNQ